MKELIPKITKTDIIHSEGEYLIFVDENNIDLVKDYLSQCSELSKKYKDLVQTNTIIYPPNSKDDQFYWDNSIPINRLEDVRYLVA